MTTRWDTMVSHALTPFTKGQDLPYRTKTGVVVTKATPADGAWGCPSRRTSFHLVAAAATAWTEHGPIFGARWLCGGSSIGVQFYRPEVFAEHFGRKAFPDDLDEMTCWKCRDVRDGTVKQPVVYRAFAKSGELLYIGSSKSLQNRLAQHRNGTWWWPVVKRIEHVVYPTLEEARAAEAAAIRAEGPKMNIQHNRGAAS